jgi:hypothetical protein
MPEDITGVADLLRELEETPLAAESPEDIERERLKLLSLDEKAAKAFDYQMRGIPVSAISTVFDVDPSTVYRWLSHYAQKFRQRIEQEPAANLIAESLLYLTRIEELCLYEANQSGSDGGAIDPKTGEVVRPKASQASAIKVKYIQAAMKARQMKTDLMIQTGILPKEPERLYHAFTEEKRGAKDSEDAATRTSEEIRSDVEQLLSRGRTL